MSLILVLKGYGWIRLLMLLLMPGTRRGKNARIHLIPTSTGSNLIPPTLRVRNDHLTIDQSNRPPSSPVGLLPSGGTRVRLRGEAGLNWVMVHPGAIIAG